MKMKIYLFSIFSLLLTYSAYGQVTIGENKSPAIGALLELTESNGLATKGLAMPRVWLEYIDELLPCVDNETANDRLIHTGLVVYNLNEELCVGLHVWKGEAWHPFIPCPDATVKFRMFKEITSSSDNYEEIIPTLEPPIRLPKGTVITSASGANVYWKNDLCAYSSTYVCGTYQFSHMLPDPITVSDPPQNNTVSLYYKKIEYAQVSVRYYLEGNSMELATVNYLMAVGTQFVVSDSMRNAYLPAGCEFWYEMPSQLTVVTDPSQNIINIYYKRLPPI